jgi:hypothetical protein
MISILQMMIRKDSKETTFVRTYTIPHSILERQERRNRLGVSKVSECCCRRNLSICSVKCHLSSWIGDRLLLGFQEYLGINFQEGYPIVEDECHWESINRNDSRVDEGISLSETFFCFITRTIDGVLSGCLKLFVIKRAIIAFGCQILDRYPVNSGNPEMIFRPATVAVCRNVRSLS